MLWLAGGLMACATAGGLAGAEAGRSVEGFYTALPAPRYQPIATAMPPSSPADWDQAPVVAAGPAPGWAAAAGASERAFFDTGTESRAYEADLRLTREERELLGLDAAGRPVPVRVHRPAVRHAVLDQPADKVQVEVDTPKESVEERPDKSESDDVLASAATG